MAKDDYHVIAYRILAYLYACLKEGAQPNLADFGFEKYGIKESYWNFIILELAEKGYIKGIEPMRVIGCREASPKLVDIGITGDGVEYLIDNSMMSKARDVLLKAAEIVPGLIIN